FVVPLDFMLLFFLRFCCDHCALHSFPTRRSSDLVVLEVPTNGLPRVLHWGQDLGELTEADLEALVASGPQRALTSLPSNGVPARSEEHTSELQSRFDLVCRLLLEKKNIKHNELWH